MEGKTSMVNDLEKQLENIRNQIHGKKSIPEEEKGKEQKKPEKYLLQILLTPVQTCKLE